MMSTFSQVLTSTDSAIDFQDFLARVDGDYELAQELIQSFLEEEPHLMEAARDAVSRRSCSEAETAGHTLKGMVGVFSARRAVEATSFLESTGRRKNVAGLDGAYQVVADELRRLRSELMSFV
jgi:two-component system sensor histidine kinase/response regulator